MHKPAIICFGQQPNGFFPKRFLVAKINTARRLQKEVGGKIVFFYHDSDADYRETISIMRDKTTNEEVRLNFTQENKLQKKHSPLYAKRVPAPWKEEMLKQLPRFIPPPSPSGRGAGGEGEKLIEIFAAINEKTAADFCLEMYKKMGLLHGIEIIRSSDKTFRQQACDIKDGFADVEYQGEVVRARLSPLQEMERDKGRGRTDTNQTSPLPLPILWGGEEMILSLHEGGEVYTYLPKPDKLLKVQISPGADERFKWMNSVINSTHYIYGEGEKDYLKFEDFPEVKFIPRDAIDNPNYAYIPNL